jgi:putative sigma-54 modulation protein
MEISPALRASVIEKIGRLDRYVDGMERADVHFSEERNPRIENKELCEDTLQGRGHYVLTARTTVDLGMQQAAQEAMNNTLRHSGSSRLAFSVPRQGQRGQDPSSRRRGRIRSDDTSTWPRREAAAVAAEVEPVVVKTKRFVMSPMTLEEAMLEMDMLSHKFFLFVRAETGAPSVLYQRDEGDLGLIEISS